MKHFCLFPLALLMAACGSKAPSIDFMEEDSYSSVEQLITEDDTEAVSHRLDRYTLDQHPDKLSYTGTAKVTEFTRTADEDGTVQVDSSKYYLDIVINFHGTDYDKYTVNAYAPDEGENN